MTPNTPLTTPPLPPPYFIAPTRPRFILLGDSLTERSFDVGGWGASLAHSYTRKVDVINRGHSGYNTRWILQLLPFVFPQQSADAASPIELVTIFLGANDAAMPTGPVHSARQHVPVDEFKSNLLVIVDAAKNAGSERIVLIAPPPVDDAGRKKWQYLKVGDQAADMPLDRTNDFTKQYAAAAKEAARELELPVLDLFTELQQQNNWAERLLCDGLHFTSEGQQLVGKLLIELLAKEFPDLKPETMASQFPAWDQIDPQNPASLFQTQKQ